MFPHVFVLVGLLAASVFAWAILFPGSEKNGRDSRFPELPPGVVALVEEAPGEFDEISETEYSVAFRQAWKRSGLQGAPKVGDSQYKKVRDGAMNDLLDQAWLTGEAEELGISATDREVRNELKTIKENQFPNEKAYEKFLEDSGYDKRQVLDRVKLQVLSRKIEEDIQKGAGKPTLEQQALTDFITEYNAKWTSRTVCASGYIVIRCANFRDPVSGRKKPVIDPGGGEAPTKLETSDLVRGSGRVAREGDTVEVDYVGALFEDGTEFDSSWSTDQQFTVTLGSGQVIEGWEEGLLGMREGGRREIVVPPQLGYGKTGQMPAIPPDSTLIFVVDLLRITSRK